MGFFGPMKSLECRGTLLHWTFCREVQQWSPVVQVAALDCAEEKNLEICRDHSVDSYPTIKVSLINLCMCIYFARISVVCYLQQYRKLHKVRTKKTMCVVEVLYIYGPSYYFLHLSTARRICGAVRSRVFRLIVSRIPFSRKNFVSAPSNIKELVKV